MSKRQTLQVTNKNSKTIRAASAGAVIQPFSESELEFLGQVKSNQAFVLIVCFFALANINQLAIHPLFVLSALKQHIAARN